MIEQALVTTDWLAGRLGHPRLRWWTPRCTSRPADAMPAAEYAAGHLPGAVFFDLEASSDRRSPLPHMLPAAAEFAERMSALGLDDADDIVVYDGSGANLSAARVWWMFRVFGHDRVAVLDGGIGKWRREGRPIERGSPRGHREPSPRAGGRATRSAISTKSARRRRRARHRSWTCARAGDSPPRSPSRGPD